MKQLNENFLKIAAVIITILLSLNAFFAKDLVAGLKEQDSNLYKRIRAVDEKYTSKFEKLSHDVSENEKNIGLSDKDIEYIKEAVDEIKKEVSKK